MSLSVNIIGSQMDLTFAYIVVWTSIRRRKSKFQHKGIMNQIKKNIKDLLLENGLKKQ